MCEADHLWVNLLVLVPDTETIYYHTVDKYFFISGMTKIKTKDDQVEIMVTVPIGHGRANHLVTI